MRGRVRHRRTGAPGDAVEQLTGREGTVFPGPWSRVQFDDGLECWCPDDELVVKTSDVETRVDYYGHRHNHPVPADHSPTNRFRLHSMCPACDWLADHRP